MKTPMTIAGMSFGALSAPGEGGAGSRRQRAGTSTTTGDGGMTERNAAFQDPGVSGAAVALRHEPRRSAQGRCDRGGGGAGRQAGWRRHVAGAEDHASASRRCETCRKASISDRPAGIPTGPGPTICEIKIEELREITDWQKPIYVKVGASRPYYDTALAVKAGADVVVIDGMQGGTAATQEVFIENVGIPTLAAIRPAVQALQELGMHRKVQLIVSGGIRSGADVAKALALGADAVSIGTAALIALGDNDPALEDEYRSSARRRARMTTGTKAAIPRASPRRIRRWWRGSIRCWRAGGWPTTCR